MVKAGAKSAMTHGFGKEKLASVSVIKDVIEKGEIISYTPNYNQADIDRDIVVGRGIIDEKPVYVGVVIKS